jgi:hypothetical protein
VDLVARREDEGLPCLPKIGRAQEPSSIGASGGHKSPLGRIESDAAKHRYPSGGEKMNLRRLLLALTVVAMLASAFAGSVSAAETEAITEESHWTVAGVSLTAGASE